MRLYIKSAHVQEKLGLMVYNERGERVYSVSIEHSVLGLKLDVYNVQAKRVSKIRQHGFSFNKTYNITTRGKNIKFILKVEKNNVSAFVKGAPITLEGDVLKKTFSLLGENKSLIMAHKYNFKNYYELDILQEDFELLSLCVALCVDTLLFFGEKKTQRDMAFFMRLILGNKELLGSLQETFSANTCKFDELKNED